MFRPGSRRRPVVGGCQQAAEPLQTRGWKAGRNETEPDPGTGLVVLMSVPFRTTSKRSRVLLFLAVLAAGVGLSFCLSLFLKARETAAVKAEFRFDADQRIGSIQRTLAGSLDVLAALEAFYRASERVTAEEFHIFTERFLDERPGIRQLAFAVGVPATERQVHETALKEEIDASYQIVEPAPDGAHQPAQPRDEYFPVVACEPQGSPGLVAGLDLGCSAELREAIARARQSGRPEAVQAQGILSGIKGKPPWLVVMPVQWPSGVPSATAPSPFETPAAEPLPAEGPGAGERPPEERPAESSLQSGRKEQDWGLAVGVFQLAEIVDAALVSADSLGIDFYLFDTVVDGPPEQVYKFISHERVERATPLETLPPTLPEISYKADVHAWGREWVGCCLPTDLYVARRRTWMPAGALMGASILSLLVALYVNALVGRSARVEQLVVQRTGQLRETTARLEAEVAERRRTEAVLRDSEALYSSLVENLPVHVLRKNLEGRFTFANRSFCALLGRPLEGILGKTDLDFYPPELAEKYRRDDEHVALTGELLEDVEEYQKAGETRYMHVMKSPVRDASGRVVGTQAVFWDVTARKRAEQALDRERYLLHALMDNLPDAIYFKDRESRFLRISRALAEKFGLADAAEAEGKTDFDFFAEEHARQAREDELALMRTGQPVLNKEEKETWPDGRATWVATNKLPLRDQVGRIVGTFGISRDITQQKQAAEALRAAKEAAEAANRAKSAFLANISHEIRTPLNAIIGLTELVLETTLSAEQRDHLNAVRESGETLLSLINDILDFSKIEAQRLVLEASTFDLRETLGDTMKWLAVRAHEKGLELACRFRPEVPQLVVGDRVRLRQVIVNLVGNAIKFTEQGEVVLDVGLEDRESTGGERLALHFAVADTGVGIPEDKRESIFGLFEQADTSTTRKYGGTGLGLAISQKLVELMGGRIGVESEVGRGSTFHFTARFRTPPEPVSTRPGPAVATLDGLPVLIVDDNATNRRILEEMFAAWKMQPATAASAAEALDRLRQARQAGQPYRLVITDAHMPEMDGFGLVERIRREPELDGTVIMMLTSGDRSDDVTRCERLGVAAYLLKPVKQSELFDAIQMVLGGIRAEHEEARRLAAQRPAKARPLRVLVAEDSLVGQKLILGLLERRGDSVALVQNGREAVAKAMEEPFDLILMDVQMPEMDGLEATAAIRAREKRSGLHVPIVAMTAHAMEGDRRRCLEAGMDEYLAKPLRAERLFDTIDRLAEQFGLTEGGKAAPRVEPAGPVAESSPAHTGLGGGGAGDLPPGEGVIDWDEALRVVRGDHMLLRGVVASFLDEGPALLAALGRHVQSGQQQGVRQAAHTLKGSLRCVGAAVAADRAEQLEMAARSGDLAEARSRLAELETDFHAAVAVLRRLGEATAGNEDPQQDPEHS